MAKKYNRCGHVPFKEPQPESIYQKVRRADKPLKKALELNVLDKKKMRKIHQELKEIMNSNVDLICLIVAFLTYFYI